MSDAPSVTDDGPFEEQRQIYGLLSQETRHLILQYILGQPAHLPSLDELAYLMPKNKAAIRDQLQVLSEAGIIECYEYQPNENSRDIPSQFYGLTEHGVTVLDEYNYLRGLPIARALYGNTRLSEKAQRHRNAPRPDLPSAVRRALVIEADDESTNIDRIDQEVRERKGRTHSVDDQVAVANAFYTANIGPDHEGIKQTELQDTLDVDIEHQPKTVLDHLVEIDLLEETTPPGPDVFAISERIDGIVNGRVTEEAEENIEALIAHIDDELQSVELDDDAAELQEQRLATATPSVALSDGAGRTIRSILATEFDIPPERVADYLRSGDPITRLDTAIDAIESSEEVSKSEDYGRIVSLNQAYRYRLTEHALDLL